MAEYDNTDGSLNGYALYGVGIGKTFEGLDFALNYTKTNNDTAANDESNTVLSISKSF